MPLVDSEGEQNLLQINPIKNLKQSMPSGGGYSYRSAYEHLEWDKNSTRLGLSNLG